MSHHSNPAALPSIHRGAGASVKLSDTSATSTEQTGTSNYNRVTYASAKSLDNLAGRISHTDVHSQGVAASIETLLPMGDEDNIDMGRIRIERRSHRQLLPPSVS